MPKAIRYHKTGGPEVLRFEDVAVGRPGAGEVRLRHTAIGLNYIDTYLRSGLYPLLTPPAIPGVEGAGIVEEVGPEVTEVALGERVAYAALPPGAYAETRLINASSLVPLPDDIDDRQAAGMMLKGMTAQFLLRRTHSVKAGETILVHAAAGGIGSLLCQWAKHLGATVIGTVGTEEKARAAAAHGCDHPIVYTKENFVERVREITKGEGVPVVYDAVGRATFAGSIECLAIRGLMVSFGQASGPVEPIDVRLLSPRSLFLTRPMLFHYTRTRDELLETANEVFKVVRSGAVRIAVNQTYPLAEAQRAHADLEARRTTGSTVLLP
jgi:NADPH2:quinone reductase